MKDDNFDAEIKKILQDFEGHDDSSSSWSRMSDRLDEELSATESDIQDFDERVRSQMENYTIPVSEDDWLKLKHELNLAEERKEKIIISKVIEIATILLLIITISKYKTLTTPVDMDPMFMATLQEEHPRTNLLPEKEIHAISNKEYVFEKLKTDALVNSSSSKEIYEPISKATSPVVQNTLTSGTLNFSEQRVGPTLRKDILLINPTEVVIQKIESLPLQRFSTPIELPQAPFFDILYALDRKSNSIRDGWSVGVPISTDINFINSSFNVNYLRTQLNNNLSGKTIGLSASYRKGILEIETGVRYSSKRFAPGLISYTPASSKSFLLDELDEAKIKQLQIPLIAKIYVQANRKLNVYAMTGISTNIILDMDYTISKSIQANARPSALPHVDALDLKNLPIGVAQGGDLNDNLYMTALVGFGIQYHMTNSVGIYLQPQYQHTLTKNINDVASKINSLNLEAGLKYKF